jgi:AraC-like DNA-binding protein
MMRGSRSEPSAAISDGESPYAYLTTRRIERAMALLRRGDPSVNEVCFAVGCSSLGIFSSRFTELVGVPPSVYRRQAARFPADEASDGHPRCIGPPRLRNARLGVSPREH